LAVLLKNCKVRGYLKTKYTNHPERIKVIDFILQQFYELKIIDFVSNQEAPQHNSHCYYTRTRRRVEQKTNF